MKSVLTIRELLEMMKKRSKVIIFTMCLFGMVGMIGVFYVIQPQYEARTQLIVSLQSGQTDGQAVNEINANLMMVNTYKDFIQEGTVLAEQVRKQLEREGLFSGSNEKLKKLVRVTQQQNSQMFTISVRANSPILAAQAANLFASGFKDTVKEILNGTDKITIIAPAAVPKKAVFPKPIPTLTVVLSIGGFVGFLAALGLEFLDVRVKTRAFLEEDLGHTILGVIPFIPEKDYTQPYRYQTIEEEDRAEEDQTNEGAGAAVKKNQGEASLKRKQSRMI